MTLYCPSFLFIWGPLCLGMPHLLADLRYLVFSPRMAPLYRPADIVVFALLALTLVSSSSAAGALAVWGSVVLCLFAPADVRSRQNRHVVLFRLAAVILASLMCLAALRFPAMFQFALVHAHNLVALIIFAVAFAHDRTRWTVPLMILGVCVAVISGCFDTQLRALSIQSLAGFLWPAAVQVNWSEAFIARACALFVLLQSIHYTIWLRLIPEQARPGVGTRSFRSSWKALHADVGSAWIWLTLIFMLGFFAMGLVHWQTSRSLYLRVASFHAYLELVFLAKWLLK